MRGEEAEKKETERGGGEQESHGFKKHWMSCDRSMDWQNKSLISLVGRDLFSRFFFGENYPSE